MDDTGRTVPHKVMLEQSNIPVEISLDGEPVGSRTRASAAGPYVLALDTVIPARATKLHSLYTSPNDKSTHAAHLRLAPNLQETITTEHEHEAIPVTHARRHCLYDHLQQLQDLLEQTGTKASIPIDEQAIAAIER
jgi:hypothetical protein